MSRRYTRDHEWIELAGDEATVGITDYAQGHLGDITFVDLPAPGRAIAAEESVAVIDSVKAASDVYAPVAGEVTAINEALGDAPELVNSAPEGDGWLWRMRVTDPAALDALLDAEGYAAYLGTL